jgi:hypothetical protein
MELELLHLGQKPCRLRQSMEEGEAFLLTFTQIVSDHVSQVVLGAGRIDP